MGVVLFGSIAKGTYSDTSDIDIFIAIDGDTMDYYRFLLSVHGKMSPQEEEFAAEHKYFAFSPFVVRAQDLDTIRPIYFEIRDYGLVLYEKNKTVAQFFDKIDKINYTRELTTVGEVVKWKD